MSNTRRHINWHLAKETVKHQLLSGYWRGHHVHSPFVYHIIRHVITTRHTDEMLRAKAAQYRRDIYSDKEVVEVEDLGTGATRDPKRRISDIARRTSIGSKYGLMIARLAHDLNPKTIIELGTSMGMSTFYLASGASDARVISIEGSREVAIRAEKMLNTHGISNVEVRNGNFDNLLPQILEETNGAELVYIDGNHTYEATMRYFNMAARVMSPLSVIILDDIHWSEGMSRAWQEIVQDTRVMSTIDTLHMGIAYFRTGCQKEHFRLRWNL